MLANLPPEMERKINNQHLICLLGPNADRQSALAIVLDMIWKLEKTPLVFHLGVMVDANVKTMQFQVGKMCLNENITYNT